MRSVWLKDIIITSILVVCLCFSTYSELKSTVDISRIGKGARPIALGGAYTALADDTFAIFTNPAGLGIQLKPGFTSMSTKLLDSIDYRMLGGSYPLPIGNIALGYIDATAPGGTRITSSEGLVTEHGEIFYSNRIITLGYGLRFKELKVIDLPVLSFVGGFLGDLGGDTAIGVNLKMFSQGFTGDVTDSFTANGSDMDIGILIPLADNLTISTVMQNFLSSDTGEMSWTTGENEEIKGSTKLGAAYKPFKELTTVLDLDLPQGGNEPMVVHGGVEWQTSEYLAVRAGLDQNYESIDNGKTGAKTDISAGVGINFIDGFRFDYAYHSDNAIPENSTHYFSFSYFGDPIVKPVPKPPAPPAPEQSEEDDDGFGDDFGFGEEDLGGGFEDIPVAEEEEEEVAIF